MNAPSSSTRAGGESFDADGRKVWRVGTLTYTSGGLVVLFGLLLFGDFAWSMRERSVGPMSQWYLNSLNVPNVVFGLLISSFPAFLGLILNPIVSVMSDRHRGPRGRRVPFLLMTTPLAAAGMAGIGLTPILAGMLHGALAPDGALGALADALLEGGRGGDWLLQQMRDPMVVAVACFAVFWAIFEVGSITSSAVFLGLIADVVPRAVIGRFFGLFRAVSLLDGIVFNYWILAKVPVHFTTIMLVIAVFYGLAFFWVCLRVKEGAYPPPPPAVEGPVLARAKQQTLGYFRDSFSRSHYVFVFLFMGFASLVFLPFNTFAIPFARSVGVGLDVFGRALALTFMISFGLSFFLGWLADRFHPLRCGGVVLVLYGGVAIWGLTGVQDERSFLIVWVLHGVLSGCYFTSAASLPQRLFPGSRFAQFSSAAGIVGAIMSMVAAPLMGIVIDLDGGSYRHVFTASLLLVVVSFSVGCLVYRGFLRLGGDGGYVAPD